MAFLEETQLSSAVERRGWAGLVVTETDGTYGELEQGKGRSTQVDHDLCTQRQRVL